MVTSGNITEASGLKIVGSLVISCRYLKVRSEGRLLLYFVIIIMSSVGSLINEKTFKDAMFHIHLKLYRRMLSIVVLLLSIRSKRVPLWEFFLH